MPLLGFSADELHSACKRKGPELGFSASWVRMVSTESLHCSAELLVHATVMNWNCRCLSGQFTTWQRSHLGQQRLDLFNICKRQTGLSFSRLPKNLTRNKSSFIEFYLPQKYKQLSQTCWHLQYDCWSNYWNCQLLAPCCNNNDLPRAFWGASFIPDHSQVCCEAMHKLYIGSASPTHDRQPPTGWITEPPHSSLHQDQNSEQTRMVHECWSSAPSCLFFVHLLIQAMRQRKALDNFYFSLSNSQANIYSFIMNTCVLAKEPHKATKCLLITFG